MMTVNKALEKIINQQIDDEMKKAQETRNALRKDNVDPSMHPSESGFIKKSTGRPHGSRNRAALFAEQIMYREVESIFTVLVDKAKDGDMTALKIVADRICPTRKDIPVRIKTNRLKSTEDIPLAMKDIVNTALEGDISPFEAANLASAVDLYRKSVETDELAHKLDDIQSHIKSLGLD